MGLPPKKTAVTLSRLEIAIAQLDRAIELFLDHGDCICAITLAGAAEEILSSIARKKRPEKSNATSTIKNLFAAEYNLTTKEINDNYINRARNNFKHFYDGSPFIFHPLEETVQMISRALSSLHDARGALTPAGYRFVRWTKCDPTWREEPTD